MTDPREYLAPGVSGWKKRQMAAQKRRQSSEERERINEIRRQVREREAARTQYVEEAVSRGEDPDKALQEFDQKFSEARGENFSPEPEPSHENGEQEPSEVPEKKPVESMNRDELAAELEASGQKAHPRAKNDTLRRKVRALRDVSS